MRIWLPLGKPKPVPKTERDQLLNQIYEANYLIPGAEDLELAQLRDLVAYIEHKVLEEKMARVQAGAALAAQMSPKQVALALKEYLKWRKRQQKKRG